MLSPAGFAFLTFEHLGVIKTMTEFEKQLLITTRDKLNRG